MLPEEFSVENVDAKSPVPILLQLKQVPAILGQLNGLELFLSTSNENSQIYLGNVRTKGNQI
jgi:hypothetical protein